MAILRRVLRGLLVGPVAGLCSGVVVGALVSTTDALEGALTGIGIYLGLIVGASVAAMGPLARRPFPCALVSTALGIGMGYVLLPSEVDSRGAIVCAVVGLSAGMLVYAAERTPSLTELVPRVCATRQN